MEYEFIPILQPKVKPPDFDSDRYELVPLETEDDFAPVPERESPGFIGSVSGGIDKMQALGYGALGLAGSATGIDTLKDWGIEGYERNMEEAEENAPSVRMRDLRSHPEKAVTWAVETAGDLIPSMAEAAIGGLIGSLVAPGPGTAMGAFATRTLLKKGIEKAVKKGIATKIGKELGERELRKRVTGEALKKLGANAGMFGTVAQMEAGGNYAELLTEHGVDNPTSALMTGTVAAALEFLGGNSRILRKVFGGKTQKAINDAVRNNNGGYLKRLAAEIVKNPPMEALQEAGQEALSVLNIVANTDEKFFTGENLWQIAESAGAGALGGGMGVPVQAMGAGAEEGGTIPPEQERLNTFANLLNKGLPVEELKGQATPQEIENLKSLFPDLQADLDGLINPPVEDIPAALNQVRQDIEAGAMTPEGMLELGRQHPELAEGLGKLAVE